MSRALVVSSESAHWRHRLAAWAGPDDALAVRQLVPSVALFVAAWAALWVAWSVAPWSVPLAALPVAAMTVRLSVIAHDCGHGSFLRSRWARDTVAFWIGVAAWTPHRWWRRQHAAHHAHSGKIDHRVGGDVPLWTVEEYRAASALGRALYRSIRHPVGLLGLWTFVQFALVHRCPIGTPARWGAEWRSVWKTNAALVAIALLAAWADALGDYLALHAMVMYWASALAGWLTHSQHQYEQAYWCERDEWNFEQAGLEGATCLTLPGWLAWITADIGLHHVHHLAPGIPNYRLAQARAAHEDLAQARTIGWRETFGAYRYALWDRDMRKLVSFAETGVGVREAHERAGRERAVVGREHAVQPVLEAAPSRSRPR